MVGIRRHVATTQGIESIRAVCAPQNLEALVSADGSNPSVGPPEDHTERVEREKRRKISNSLI